MSVCVFLIGHQDGPGRVLAAKVAGQAEVRCPESFLGQEELHEHPARLSLAGEPSTRPETSEIP